MSTPTLAEYWDMLNRHDWTYGMSDDHSVWQRGCQQEDKLKAIAKQSAEYQAMYDGFHKYVWSGSHMGTEKQPKPERPEE